MDSRKVFGNRGEDLAATFLQEKGYQVLHRQYKNPFGEIDLICQYGNEVVFVEVKSRETDTHGYPEDSVTHAKIGHILRVADGYLATLPDARSWRIDVVAIEFTQDPPRITHIEAIDVPERFW